jgi:type II secretory pathway pseudopilin PulG
LPRLHHGRDCHQPGHHRLRAGRHHRRAAHGHAEQRDNREETIINQDATVFMEAIRNGARGADDLDRITSVESRESGAVRLDSVSGSRPSSLVPRPASAFTLVEVLVVVVLLSLIVLALMAVFNSTQSAFRASVTQADVLESGRATMDLVTADLRAMSPSGGQSNSPAIGAVNFYANTNFNEQPLIQPMIGGSSARTNVLENFFILSRGNSGGVATWYGTGYAVSPNAPSGPLYSLYRFATSHPVAAVDPAFIYTNEFRHFLLNVATNSHLMDGVVSLTVRVYDAGGYQMTNTYQNDGYLWVTNKNVLYFPQAWGQAGFAMFSNTLPASVEIEMGVLEDRALQRAESLGGSFTAQSNYLAQQAGKVHVFRQRVSIPNVDPAAYQ